MLTLDPDEIPPLLPESTRKREAEEWALVLQSEGIGVEVVRRESRFALAVAPEDIERAVRSLAAWRAEHAATAAPMPMESEAVFRAPTPAEILLSGTAAAALVAFHLGLERSGRLGEFIELGENQAALVVVGELHRCLTALTLHADLGHVFGNALIGAFFLALLAGRVGLGLALAAFVVTGTAGNLADSLYYRAGHHSIGASTGVFGLVGVLAGLAAWRRHQRAPRGRGAWVALAAGLGIVAMLGGAGPKVDLAAHLFGLAAGAITGLALAFPLARAPRPGATTQLAITFAAAAALALAWRATGV